VQKLRSWEDLHKSSRESLNVPTHQSNPNALGPLVSRLQKHPESPTKKEDDEDIFANLIPDSEEGTNNISKFKEKIQTL